MNLQCTSPTQDMTLAKIEDNRRIIDDLLDLIQEYDDRLHTALQLLEDHGIPTGDIL